MSTKLTATGVVNLRNVGKSKNTVAEGVDAGLAVVAKKKIDDVTFTLKLTEQTIQGGLQNFKGATVTANKQYKFVTSTLGYDLGTKKASAQLVTAAKLDSGAVLELTGTWKEATNQVELQLDARPNKTSKLVAAVNPHTKAAALSATKEWRDMAFTGSYNFAKHAPAVSLQKKVSGNVVKASYAPNTEDGVLEITRKPYKVSIKGKVGQRNGIGSPTISLTMERELDVRTQPPATELPGAFMPPLDQRASRSTPAGTKDTTTQTPAAKGGKLTHPAVDRDLSVDEKLRAIDAAYEQKFEQNKHNKNGVDVYTYERKKNTHI